jgi:hypothetical protein
MWHSTISSTTCTVSLKRWKDVRVRVVERHFGERHQLLTEPPRAQPREVAFDEPFALEPPHALDAGRQRRD